MSQQALHILKRFLSLYENLDDNANPDAVIFNCDTESENFDIQPNVFEAKHKNLTMKQRLNLLQKIKELDPVILPQEFDDTAALIHSDREDRLATIDPNLVAIKSRSKK